MTRIDADTTTALDLSAEIRVIRGLKINGQRTMGFLKKLKSAALQFFAQGAMPALFISGPDKQPPDDKQQPQVFCTVWTVCAAPGCWHWARGCYCGVHNWLIPRRLREPFLETYRAVVESELDETFPAKAEAFEAAALEINAHFESRSEASRAESLQPVVRRRRQAPPPMEVK